VNTELNVKVVQRSKAAEVRNWIRSFLTDNMVTVMFAVLCYVGFRLSGLSTMFIVNDLVNRVGRNGVLILALILPVLAGMGLNFAIVLGAMAGQVGIIMVVHWGVEGLPGFLLAVAISTPFAMLFGYLTGNLLNRTKGQEMITSMITGFFANGIYQLVFLVLVGTVIPMKNPEIMLPSGVGIKNTLDVGRISYAVDGIWRVKFPEAVLAGAVAVLLYVAYQLWAGRGKSKLTTALLGQAKWIAGGLVMLAWSVGTLNSRSALNMVPVPVVTFLFIGAVCVFITFISSTKLGQDFRTVGQDLHIAKVSGIAVNKRRITAITISTVLAAWGQLFFLQNVGNLNTFAAHEQVGRFAIAALLIGGASVAKATIGQALLGAVLFHTLFVVSPAAGRQLLGDAQLGEFFRAFVAYGVIAMSLGMHAWQKAAKRKS
jgi:simple sugar transport system permease protein